MFFVIYAIQVILCVRSCTDHFSSNTISRTYEKSTCRRVWLVNAVENQTCCIHYVIKMDKKLTIEDLVCVVKCENAKKNK